MLIICKIIKIVNIIPKINLFSIYNNNTVEVGYTGSEKGDHFRYAKVTDFAMQYKCVVF